MGGPRAGKTPTCLYLALHYGVRAANYPLTDDDLAQMELPARLRDGRIQDIFQAGLHEFLTDVIEGTKTLGREISGLYLY